jgi:hypothetical protein
MGFVAEGVESMMALLSSHGFFRADHALRMTAEEERRNCPTQAKSWLEWPPSELGVLSGAKKRAPRGRGQSALVLSLCESLVADLF